MKHLDEYRDAHQTRRLLEQIKKQATQPWTLMEVCGGQTHSLLKHGIVEALQGTVELIHGPGCPVCVTPAEDIDFACRISLQPDTALFSFGDMLRVPGTSRSLQQTQADGGSVMHVYSPLDAVQYARANPDRQVVFFAVGFETTAPATALAVLQAAESQLDNFSLLVSHVRVQPAMEAILADPFCRVQGFLAAGHVCTVTGTGGYDRLCSDHQIPVVITGFEPVDIVCGILECVSQLEAQKFEVQNCYGRVVRPEGNSSAASFVDRVYCIADTPWRGLGVIPCGGLRPAAEWDQFDARRKFASLLQVPSLPIIEESRSCRAADVLSGLIRPDACEAFGRDCRPDSPLGAPMVSSEGACAAYYRYRGTGA